MIYPPQNEFWYVDKDPKRERTRSSGNLFDDERYGAEFYASYEYNEIMECIY